MMKIGSGCLDGVSMEWRNRITWNRRANRLGMNRCDNVYRWAKLIQIELVTFSLYDYGGTTTNMPKSSLYSIYCWYHTQTNTHTHQTRNSFITCASFEHCTEHIHFSHACFSGINSVCKNICWLSSYFSSFLLLCLSPDVWKQFHEKVAYFMLPTRLKLSGKQKMVENCL